MEVGFAQQPTLQELWTWSLGAQNGWFLFRECGWETWCTCCFCFGVKGIRWFLVSYSLRVFVLVGFYGASKCFFAASVHALKKFSIQYSFAFGSMFHYRLSNFRQKIFLEGFKLPTSY